MARLDRPKGVIFDWDNTLVNTWPTIYAALVVAFTHFDKTPWSFAETKRRVGHSLRDAFPDIFGENWQEAGDIYLAAYRAKHLETLEILQGAEATLAFLRDHNIPAAVVSNKTSLTLRKEAQHLNWESYFKTLIGSGDAAKDKPHPEPALQALQQLGTKPQETWFIGDTYVDLACAKASGCIPILYGDGESGILEQFEETVTLNGEAAKLHVVHHGELLQSLLNS